jgi:hypothetical protein
MNALLVRNCSALALVCLLIVPAGGAMAQPVQTAPALPDTFVAAVPMRPVADIHKDTERASSVRGETKQWLARAQEEVHTLANLISVRKKDLDALEAWLDTVDTDKKANEVAKAKVKSALLDKIIDLLELRKKVRDAEVETATATIAFTEAQEELYALEGTLDKKRNDRAELAKKKGSASDLAAVDLAIKGMEEEVLDAWEKSLKRHDDAVSAEQDYVKLLRKHSEAQEKFNNP